MTRLRDFVTTIRAKRARRLHNSDTVSFDSFWSDPPSESYGLSTKESSLNASDNNANSSPKQCKKTDEYAQFGPSNSNGNKECGLPSCATILLLTLLIAVFLVLPIIYLLHCFGLLHAQIHQSYRHNQDVHHREKNHYAPSRIVVPNNFGAVLEESQESPRLVLKKSKELPPPTAPADQVCQKVAEKDKFDCYPEDGASKEKCESRGCCWVQKAGETSVSLDVPSCFYPPKYRTYRYVNITETAFGLVAYLKQAIKSPYPGDVPVIKMAVKYETENRLHVKLSDASHNRYEPPYPEVPIVDRASSNNTYEFVIDQVATGFKVVRKEDNVTIFDTIDVGGFIFADQFLQLSARLPSDYIYGLGEHRSSLLLSTKWQRFAMFNNDGVPQFNHNLYGTHPFYIGTENSGKSHGVFLLNSNAMEVILQPSPAITFRPIGGILDFYFVLGPTPGNVVQQYTDIVGRPFMPPYWSLGFHLCRFGYKTLNHTKAILKNNQDAGIPIDVQWNDLDYMNKSNDFTYDHDRYRGLPGFVRELHASGLHYIVIVDPGISAGEPRGQYKPYDLGIAMDIFVKNSSGKPFVGKVWNRLSTVWPDFTCPRTVDYWTKMLAMMHGEFNFDGAWIDMNEPSNFVDGQKDIGCPVEKPPPYVPHVVGGTLIHNTLCMTAKQYGGSHYNLHNLYGFTEAIVTSFAMADVRGKRPMVISRSTFPGHGHYAGHWSGDIYSEWQDMKYTIPQLLNFGLFGIPLMGADICGFNGDTTEPLCNRWMQLGAFYPFSRNHNTDNGIPQDPASMGPQVVASSRKALGVRYSLLPYLYTLFWAAHTRGDTVARAMFIEFPLDKNTYGLDEQFLWGSALLVVPVLTENATSVKAYLPSGLWFNFYTRKAIKSPSEGQWIELSAPLDTIPLLLRGGNVVPQQKPGNTTTESRKYGLQLLAVPDETGKGFGELYWDDGDSLNAVEERKFTLINFVLDGSELRTETVWWGSEEVGAAPPNLSRVTILGVNKPVTEVNLNQIAQNFKYDTINKVLVLDNLSVGLKENVTVSWK